MRFAVVALCCCASTALAHEVSADLAGSVITKSENNPRSGSVGAGVAGSYDFNDTWSTFAGFTYTRDLGVKTPTTTTYGANIFLINAGVMVAPTDHLMFMVQGSFSPTVSQDNATTITFGQLLGLKRDKVDLTVHSNTTSGGANVMGSWFSGGFSKVTHTIDVMLGVNAFNAYQQLEIPNSVAGARWRTYCSQPTTMGQNYCPLVNGVETPLAQVRIGAAYTLTLERHFDVGLEGAAYLYSQDPSSVGYFSVIEIGRLPDLGSGVPVAPFLFTGKALALYRFEKLALRLTYQFGQYTGTFGANHVVALRTSYKFTNASKMTLTVSGQGDATAAGFVNLGLQATLAGVLTF